MTAPSPPGSGSAGAVLVIGAGQAGLAAGYHLKRRGLPFRIVEAGERVGDAWSRRYASLTLFTPRHFSALPGRTLAGDPEGYASRDEFAAYLENYAAGLDLPVSLSTRVVRLRRREDGGFAAMLSTGETLTAHDVIVATGGFQVPTVPELARGFDETVAQYTPETYAEPSRLPAGTVLVVGDGASGRDIAAELAGNHRVLLATGKPRKLLPEHILGRSIWWWLKGLGLMRVSGDSAIGRLMRRADPFPDRDRGLASLRRRGVVPVQRLVAAEGGIARFADGASARVAAVIWAVGYRDDGEWLDIPGALDAQGRFLHQQGASPVPGLHFVGRPWQRNRASALIMGVGDDARAVVDRIARRD